MTDRLELAEALHEAEHGSCACDYLDQSYLDQADDLLPWLTAHDTALLERVEAAERRPIGNSEMAPLEPSPGEARRRTDAALAAKVADAEARVTAEIAAERDRWKLFGQQIEMNRDALAAKVARVEALIAAWSEPNDFRSIVVKTHFDLGQTQGIDIGVDAVLADLRAALTEEIPIEEGQATYDFHGRECLANCVDSATTAAETLRAAAADYMAGGWHDGILAFGTDDVVDDVSFAKATANWLDARADTIEAADAATKGPVSLELPGDAETKAANDDRADRLGRIEATGDEYELQQARMEALYQRIADRLGEHDAARNVSEGPSEEQVTILVAGWPVEDLARFVVDDLEYDFIAPIVREGLAAKRQELDERAARKTALTEGSER